MKLQRLAKMPPAELAFRLRQQVHKTMERVVASGPEMPPRLRYRINHLAGTGNTEGNFNSPAAGARLSPVQLQKALQQRMQDRFFAGISGIASIFTIAGVATATGADHAEESASKRTNKHSQQLIAGADAVRRGEFEILGYGRLSFGKPINWHLDPVSGRVAPSVHWSLINPLDIEQVGDSKVVWELNRHQWLLELGQAFRLTGEEHYARCFAEYIRHWMLANPPAWGINWSSALEVSLRLISWCWALCLFSGAKALTPDLSETMLAWIQRHALFVEQHLSRYFSPNTHLTVEALGLFYAGILLPELEGAERWRKSGYQILVEQLPLQVYADGVYFEQSTRYQYYTAEIYLHFVILAEKNALPVPGKVKARLEKLFECLLQLQRPDGSVPQIGDTDGGWLLPLVRRAPGDCRGLFSTAALMFQNRQFAWAADGVTQEALILHGSTTAEASFLLKPMIPPPAPLTLLQQGGYVVMRNGWDRHAHQLVFDTGPLGSHVCSGHGHADLLAIQCCAWGETYLIDSGTGCYTSDLQWRNYFRSSRAHSTIMVDGRGQAQPNGPFSWLSRPAAQLRQCSVEPGYLLAEAQHDAYSGLPDPVTHRRRVMMSDAGYWIVVDDLMGDAMHHLELRYQFAPLPVTLLQDGWLRAQGVNSALWIKIFSSVPLNLDIQNGELDPIGGWYSPNYGQRVPAPALSCSTRGRLPLRLVTVIYPVQDPSARPPEVGIGEEADEIVSVAVGPEWPHTLHLENGLLPACDSASPLPLSSAFHPLESST